ncbi:MAG TPA: phosphoribosylamine--glycine ligase [Clostridiaceae bacterium]|nr:phosphoribosylamine--glycine ligase [Clostridiaceae bacterium]
MKILIIGNGGREHAIAEALLKNKKTECVYISTHNGGAKDRIINAELTNHNIETIDEFLAKTQIDLVVVGPEQFLSEGIIDHIQSKGIKAFGPHKAAARLESSKAFAKEFMEKYQIPTAGYFRYDNYDDALTGLPEFGYPVVIKADGLCGGKGVSICQNEKDAVRALTDIFHNRIFGNQGTEIVMEQFLSGFEASLLCFVSGNKIYPFDTAMDYKKIYDNDLGPNTGGVGCISPNPYWTVDLDQQSNQIIRQIEKGLAQEKLGFTGILFIGYLIENGKLYVLEFNTRFGDPETEVLLPRLKSDLLTNIMQAIDDKPVELDFAANVAMTTILVSQGYPGKYETGHEITGLDLVDPDILIYHNGTKQIIDSSSDQKTKIVTNGGRVLSVVAVKENLAAARQAVYNNIDKIHFDNMSYRTDIGKIIEIYKN